MDDHAFINTAIDDTEGMLSYEAREASSGIEIGAKKVAEEGVFVDLEMGKNMLETAVRDVIGDINDLLNQENF